MLLCWTRGYVSDPNEKSKNNGTGVCIPPFAGGVWEVALYQFQLLVASLRYALDVSPTTHVFKSVVRNAKQSLSVHTRAAACDKRSPPILWPRVLGCWAGLGAGEPTLGARAS